MASCGDDKAMAAKKLNLDNFLPYRLSIASNVLSSRIAAEYENRFGLKIPEWRLMAVLKSEEHTSELQSLMRISHAVFCLKKKKERVQLCLDCKQLKQTTNKHT